MDNTYRDFYNIRILNGDGVAKKPYDVLRKEVIAASSSPIGQFYNNLRKVVFPDGRVGYDTSAGLRGDKARCPECGSKETHYAYGENGKDGPYLHCNECGFDAEADMNREGAPVPTSPAAEWRIRHDDLAARVANLETENASLIGNCRDYEQRLKSSKAWISKALLAFQKIEAAMQELNGED